MGDLDDRDDLGDGDDRDEPGAPDTPRRRDGLDGLLGRLDVLDAFDDLTLGGATGLATGVEIVADSFSPGPAGALDAFEPVRDIADHTDLFDDLF